MDEAREEAGGMPQSRRGSGWLRRLFIYMLVAACCVGIIYCGLRGLIDYRWEANQWTAYTSLRSYASAQITFSYANYSAIPGNTSAALGENAYADNFRNLYYGRSGKGELLQLITKGVADAFLADNALSSTPTCPGAAETAKPYAGYYFMEDAFGMLPASGYDKRFAFMAFPAVYGETGYCVYWVDETGEVLRHDPKAPTGTPAKELVKWYRPPTPLADSPLISWEK